MEDGKPELIPLEEKITIKLDNENNSNIKNKNNHKSIKVNNNNNIKQKNKKFNPNDNLIVKRQKRKRDYSPLMDIENDEDINNNNYKMISNNTTKINKTNKRLKIPLMKLIKRFTINEPKESKENNIQKNKKTRGIKIFSDMSVSEISNNLFKNYYPCILPEYYPEQITQQIIDNQIEKLINNFNKEKKEEINNKKIKMTQNMDYLRELAEKQGEWVEEQNDNYIHEKNIEEEYENKSYDSNSENNPNNSYPEDESIENEDDEDNEDNYEEKEQNFEDEYNYYENDDQNYSNE